MNSHVIITRASLSMTALSNSHICLCKHKPILKNLISTRNEYSRLMLTRISCRKKNLDPNNHEFKEDEKKGKMLVKIFGDVDKLGKGLKDNLSPKQKGDWKDLTLMSLSFAVYIYMSQKIVCAYCAYMSMVRQPW